MHYMKMVQIVCMFPLQTAMAAGPKAATLAAASQNFEPRQHFLGALNVSIIRRVSRLASLLYSVSEHFCCPRTSLIGHRALTQSSLGCTAVQWHLSQSH